MIRGITTEKPWNYYRKSAELLPENREITTEKPRNYYRKSAELLPKNQLLNYYRKTTTITTEKTQNYYRKTAALLPKIQIWKNFFEFLQPLNFEPLFARGL